MSEIIFEVRETRWTGATRLPRSGTASIRREILGGVARDGQGRCSMLFDETMEARRSSAAFCADEVLA